MNTTRAEHLYSAHYLADKASERLSSYCHGEDMPNYEPSDTDALLRTIAEATTAIAFALLADRI